MKYLNDSINLFLVTCYIGFVAAALVLNMMIPHSKMHGSASLATAFDYVSDTSFFNTFLCQQNGGKFLQ